MKTNKVGLIVFLICAVVLVVVAWGFSWSFVPTFRALSPEELSASIWSPSGALFSFWSFAAIFGMFFAFVGMLIYVQPKGKYLVAMSVLVFLLMLVGGFFPRVFYPPIFGISGGLILAFFLLICWFWAKRRITLDGQAGTAADLQLAGYLFFLGAAWQLCGLFGPPSFILRPEKMAEYGTSSSILGTVLMVLFYLVLGWFFSFFSNYLGAKAVAKEAKIAEE